MDICQLEKYLKSRMFLHDESMILVPKEEFQVQRRSDYIARFQIMLHP